MEETKDSTFDNEDVVNLESLIKGDGILSYDPACIRKKSNWSKSSNSYKFDKEEFEPKVLLNDIPTHSPKLQSLLQKIEELDRKDKKKYGKLFKHFIFSDLKSGPHGAKLLASSLIAKGMTLGYTAELKSKVKGKKTQQDDDDDDYDEDEDGTALDLVSLRNANKTGGEKGGDDKPKKVKNPYTKIELLSEDELAKNKQNNFFLLSSVSVYEQPISTAMKKSILQTFNKRPDNIYGDMARIIVMDSGFKEGIDLFDIKYIHIFEPSVVNADEKQVIGRGTRTCGQKGLEFHPTRGWPLYVYIYDLSIPEKLKKGFMNVDSIFDLYLKTMNLDVRLFHFAHDLEKTTIVGSVDYDLNKNIHTFSIPNEDGEEDDEFVYGGGPKIAKKPFKLRIRDDAPIFSIPGPQSSKRMGHTELRQFIADNYGEFAWDAVKMENLCADKQKGGSGDVIKYTPTQDFIRNYFNPMNPVKGMLLYHSVGTGKTCSAIAAATTGFEKQNYTILWVTRTTLKNDIWKNMFDQVCNESIRNKIKNSGLEIPNDQPKRMKLLSNSWNIRPMSYKQFSNLVSKKNAFYTALVKKNGEVDPLRKTLLIIDEAHKLYGGGDLSSIERPDMNLLHQALMNSYQNSGSDSVRLLLMTATPITQNPMELIQLINLCKPRSQQMPTDFATFSTEYLNDNGEFNDSGREKYLDDIAGYVSYLNREKDARQFSQPHVEHIMTPLIEKFESLEKFDKKLAKEGMKSDVDQLKSEIIKKGEELNGELGELDANKFRFLNDEICGDLEGKPYKQCSKIVKQNVKDLMQEAKAEVKRIRDEIKEIKGLVKSKNELQRKALSEIQKNKEDNEDEYKKYKESMVYALKNTCGIKISGKAKLLDMVNTHPAIEQYNVQLKAYSDKITELEGKLKEDIQGYKARTERLKKLLKTDLSELEHNVIKMTLNEEKKVLANVIKLKKKETVKVRRDINDSIKKTQKNRKKQIEKIKKTIKNVIKNGKKKQKGDEREAKKLRKTLRKEGALREEIKHDLLVGLVDKYKAKILDNLVDLDEDAVERQKEKEQAKQRKQEEKQAEKQRKQEEKQAEKQRKQEEKMAEKKRKQETRKQEKEALRKTKKVKPI